MKSATNSIHRSVFSTFYNSCKISRVYQFSTKTLEASDQNSQLHFHLSSGRKKLIHLFPHFVSLPVILLIRFFSTKFVEKYTEQCICIHYWTSDFAEFSFDSRRTGKCHCQFQHSRKGAL